MDIFHLVHRIEGHQDLGGVELSLFMGEDVLFYQQVHEIPARQVFHHEVQVLLILE